MGDEGVVDGKARQILLAEGNVELANTQVDQLIQVPMLEHVFPFQIQLAEVEAFVVLFACLKVQFTVKIDILPNRGVHEEAGLIDAKGGVGILAVSLGFKETRAAFAGDDHVAEGKSWSLF